MKQMMSLAAGTGKAGKTVKKKRLKRKRKKACF
jgi:hypothetical protein